MEEETRKKTALGEETMRKGLAEGEEKMKDALEEMTTRKDTRPHFPHLGFHGCPKPPRHEGPHDTYAPSDDAFPQHEAPSHPLKHSDSHHSQCPSTEYTHSEPTKEEPATDVSLGNQMGSLSLDLPQGRLVRIFCKENAGLNLAVERNFLQMQESNTEDEA